MRRYLFASALLAFTGCAGNPGTSAFVQTSLPATGGGANTDVVQRGNGSAEGYTFLLPPSGDSPMSGIVRGYDGNVWFGTSGQIGRINERGTVTLFNQSTGYSELSGGVSRGPAGDDHLWYTVRDPAGGNAAVARVSTPSGDTTERPMPRNIQVLWGIAAGPDKAMYAASYGSNMIVRIPADGGDVKGFRLPGPVPGRPLNIALGPDRAMWFTMDGAGSIGRFDTTSHAISYYPIKTPDAGAIAEFNGAIYFIAGYDRNSDYIGKMTTTGQLREISLPAWNSKVRLEALCEGPDGNLWAGGFGSLWSISKAGVVSGPTQIPGITRGPSYLSAGPDGNLWSLNDAPASISVYLLHALRAVPASFHLQMGLSAPLAVFEKSRGGKIQAKSTQNAIATVSVTGPGSFNVTGVGVGSTTIHVSDSDHNFVDLPVSVSP